MKINSKADVIATVEASNISDAHKAGIRKWCDDLYAANTRMASEIARLRSETPIPSPVGERVADRPGEGESFPPHLSTAAQDVMAERRRQIEAEGWTSENDDAHHNGEMAQAAATYALSSTGLFQKARLWPWRHEWWKPSTPRRDLIKAGALIIAEIERLDRAKRRA